MRTPPRRHPARRARRTDRDPRRVGGPPPRPRRRDLHRPAGRAPAPPRWCSARARWPSGRTGCGRSSACRSSARSCRAPTGNENPELPTGADRGHRHRADGAVGVGAAAVPGRRAQPRSARRSGCKYRYLDLRRSRPGRRDAAAQRGQPDRPRGAARARLRRGRDAHAHPVDPGGRPRLPRARPAAARLLVRAAAEPAAVQAAAHGRRDWSATTRSPAATATRTSAPTGSPSSPSSTSR